MELRVLGRRLVVQVDDENVVKWIAEYYKPDLIMVPIGGHFVMDPRDAAYATREMLKPRFAIPFHYGTFPVLRGTYGEGLLAEIADDALDAVVVGERRDRATHQHTHGPALRAQGSDHRAAEEAGGAGDQCVGCRKIDITCFELLQAREVRFDA